eukprot:4555851-Alexandrium_andersonii.AAC.1
MGEMEFLGLSRLPLRFCRAVEGGGHGDGARRRHAPRGLAAGSCQDGVRLAGAAKAHRSVPAPDAAKG